MSNNTNPYNNQERNLSDVFKELQEARYNQSQTRLKKHQQINQFSKIKNTAKNVNFSFNLNLHKPKLKKIKKTDIKISRIFFICVILLIATVVLFAKNGYAESTEIEYVAETPTYELNEKKLDIQNIISSNVDIGKVKEQVTEERVVEFETKYTDKTNLPQGEEIVTQQGSNGKNKVTVVKTYENNELIDELVLATEKIEKATPKLVDRGTSEFLKKHKAHIGDAMYITKNTTLKKSPNTNSEDLAEVKENIDVELLDLPNEEWCKVSFDTIQGYIQTSNITSSYSSPNIVEKSRIQRLLLKVNIDMELNKTSGLTQNDYKKIFTGLTSDKNKIFEENYLEFYNADKNYNMNGIFLASIAIHESNWGTSQIAQDKKNLFGYGSFDRSPYESSFEFTSYSEGIVTVAKSLVKYYLNPSGTKIYDGETAKGTYFNGSTLKDVNTRYASDQEWHTKVFKYMELLYNRL